MSIKCLSWSNRNLCFWCYLCSTRCCCEPAFKCVTSSCWCWQSSVSWIVCYGFWSLRNISAIWIKCNCVFIGRPMSIKCLSWSNRNLCFWRYLCSTRFCCEPASKCVSSSCWGWKSSVSRIVCYGFWSLRNSSAIWIKCNCVFIGRPLCI